MSAFCKTIEKKYKPTITFDDETGTWLSWAVIRDENVLIDKKSSRDDVIESTSRYLIGEYRNQRRR